MGTAVLEENLHQLLDQIQRAILSAGLDSSTPKQCTDIAHSLPLTHARSSAQFVKITEDKGGVGVRVLSPAKIAFYFGIPIRPDSAESALGTCDFVFLYCGQFRYPETQVGFLFAPTFENAFGPSCEASPFDSGSLHKHAAWPDVKETATAFLARHSLQVPEYRTCLACRLHYLFDEPKNYLGQSESPVRSDPIGLVPRPPATIADPRLWTFEVRVQDEIDLSSPHLKAVFYSARLESEPSVVAFLSRQPPEVYLEQLFVDDDGAFHSLQSACLDYLQRQGIIS